MVREIFSNPVIQYGFAGLSLILLGFLWWLMKNLIRLIEDNNKVIVENTDVIRSLIKNSDDQLSLQRRIHENIIKLSSSGKRVME